MITSTTYFWHLKEKSVYHWIVTNNDRGIEYIADGSDMKLNKLFNPNSAFVKCMYVHFNVDFI